MAIKKDLPPIRFLPTDKENIRLSKAEFIAKRKRQKEEEQAVAEFKLKRKQPKEDKDGVRIEEEKGKEEVVKRGRPKKVE